MRVEFAVDFRLAPRVFLRILQVSSLNKNQDRGPASKPATADVASSLNIVIKFPNINDF